MANKYDYQSDPTFQLDWEALQNRGERGVSGKDLVGGVTAHGITQPTLDAYSRLYNKKSFPVSQLTPEQAAQIGYDLYYKQHNIGNIVDPQIRSLLFDAYYMSKPQTMAKKFSDVLSNELGVSVGRKPKEVADFINSIPENKLADIYHKLYDARSNYVINETKAGKKHPIGMQRRLEQTSPESITPISTGYSKTKTSPIKGSLQHKDKESKPEITAQVSKKSSLQKISEFALLTLLAGRIY